MAKTNETKRIPTIKATLAPMYRDAIQTDTENWDGADAAWIELAFPNGKKIEFSTKRLTSGLFFRACAHGLKQKLVDAAAISRDPETGRSATPEDKQKAVERVYERLMAGMWNEPREGGGGGSLLFKALCRVYADKTPDVLREWLAGKSDEQKAALKKNAKIAEAILAIQAEAAKDDGIDSDELLNELE